MSFEIKEIERKTKEALEQDTAGSQGEPLSDSIRRALKNYFSQLHGETPKELYRMVLEEVEAPLLETVMKKTGNNQVLTTTWLGLSRGNVRTKLRNYGLLSLTQKKRSKNPTK